MRRGEQTLGEKRQARDAMVAELDRSLAHVQSILTLGHASAVELLVKGMTGVDQVMQNMREALSRVMVARQALGLAIVETKNKEKGK